MRHLDRSQCSLVLFFATALVLPLCQSRNTEAAITGSFELGIDQNLIVLDGTANIKNIQAAIAQGVANGDDVTDLQESLSVAELDDLTLASMWRPYTNVLMERERPGVFLSNGVNSNANIVSMEISLSNSSNQFKPFENGKFIQASFASGEYKLFDMNTYDYQRIDPDQVSINANVLDGGQRLALSFGNGGIQPGRATTFNVYSSAGMGLDTFFSDASEVTVVYQDPSTGDIASTRSTLGNGISTFNQDLVTQLMHGTNASGIHFRDTVGAFTLTQAIPEPTSLLLLGSGLACFVLRRRRVGAA